MSAYVCLIGWCHNAIVVHKISGYYGDGCGQLAFIDPLERPAAANVAFWLN